MKYFVFCALFILFSCSDVEEEIQVSASSTHSELVVAVASNFYLSLQALINNHPEFSNTKIVTGSSGTLYAQALNGAPFDIFIAADNRYPTKLYEENKSLLPVTYAFGKLAIFPYKGDINSLKSLLSNWNKIVIANPDIAPYGKAAKHVLDKYGVATDGLIIANNVSQAFQFVDTGNAEIGFVAESLLMHAQNKLKDDKYLEYTLVPASDYPPIQQQLTILKSSKLHSKAHALVNHLLSLESQTKIELMGYFKASDQVVSDTDEQTSTAFLHGEKP